MKNQQIKEVVESLNATAFNVWLLQGGDPNLVLSYADYSESLLQNVLSQIDEPETDEPIIAMLKALVSRNAKVNVVNSMGGDSRF